MLERSSMTLKKVVYSCKLLHFISKQPSLIRQLNPHTRQLSPNNARKPVLGCGTAGPTPLFVLQGRARCSPLRALSYTSGLVLYSLQIQHGRAFPLYIQCNRGGNPSDITFMLFFFLFVHWLGVSIRKRKFSLPWGQPGNALDKWSVSKGSTVCVCCM